MGTKVVSTEQARQGSDPSRGSSGVYIGCHYSRLVCDWSTQIILSPDWFSSVQLSTKLLANLIAMCNGTDIGWYQDTQDWHKEGHERPDKVVNYIKQDVDIGIVAHASKSKCRVNSPMK